MPRLRLNCALAVVLVPLGAAAQASATRLPKLFADGMVVQRGAPIPVWGWGAPNATVAVTFRGATRRGATRRATAGADGAWKVQLPAATAGGPYELTVAGAGDTVRVRDVLVGDVWVASGQSNMELEVMTAANATQEIAAAHDSLLRQFKVPISWSERATADLAGGSWAPADPRHVSHFSAVAYYFARELRKTERVPIGIVNTTWGGSAIETWLSAETQHLGPEGAARALAREKAGLDSTRRALMARVGDVAAHDPGLVDGRAAWADPALDDAAWKPIKVPALWESQGYDGMDGVAWYRTTFTLSADEAAKGATLALGTVDDDDITWVNGVEVGRTAGYNVPRRYTVPAGALRAGANVLAVRVVDGSGGGGIYGEPVRLEVGGAARTLDGPWKFRVGEIAVSLDGQRINKVPAITYNEMVSPLLPIAVKGVIWYQGESNANDAAQAAAYRAQFRDLVTSWRRAFTGGASGTFPFLWVQLPNYGAADSAPQLRPAWALQRESMDGALALPKTGRAITIDIGEPGDIHPKNKQDVGKRLALVARRVAYGESVRDAGPTYQSHAVQGSRVTVRFTGLAGGLVARGANVPNGGVGAFVVAGADKKFVPAQARVEGDHVVVWSDAVPHPTAVRYAWANNPPDANLYNRDGLPAAPFRTDNW